MYLCSPFVSSGDIAWPSSDTFTLYSDFGGVTDAVWFPIAAADEAVIEDAATACGDGGRCHGVIGEVVEPL